VSKRITPFLELADAELVAKLGELKEELFNLRFQAATGVLENNARIGVVKRDVARVNTVLRAREIAAAESLAAGKK
jgi:large subunit ribosomal protein L29